MAAVNIDDLLEGLDNQVQKGQNVDSLIESLGEYKPEPESTNITSEYLKKGKDLLKTGARQAELVGRGMAQTVPSTVAGFTMGGPIGGLVGSAAIPFGDTLNSIINRVAGTNLRMPSEVVSSTMSKLGYKEPQTQSERVVEAAGGGLGGASSELSSMFNLAKPGATGLLPEMGKAFTKDAGKQLAVAPVAASGGQYTAEETGSPFAGLLASLGIGAAGGLSTTRKATNAPTHEDLIRESKNLYDKAKSSGVEFDPEKFSTSMQLIQKDMRNSGYAEDLSSPIDRIFKELKRTDHPKDYTELQALRTMMRDAQSSNDGPTRKFASILKDEFDHYVVNAPEDHVTSGNPQGMKDWRDAQKSYTKLKKSEMFDDMLKQAEVEGPSLFTQSGTENSLAKQLRQLVRNDKKMRTFTSDEQEAIREAAKGGTVQNMLRFYGKFAPTGAVPGFLNVIASNENPALGIPFAVGATGARMAATALRNNAVENLGAQMRLGAKPELSSRASGVPLTALQGITAAPSQLNMNYLRDLINQGKQ